MRSLSTDAGKQGRICIKGWRNVMKYRVLLHKSEDGYSVVCPGLPGCHAQGDSEDEALGNIREVIQDFLARREEMFWQDVREGEEMREVEVAV